VVLGATIDTVQLAGFFLLFATIAALHWVPVRVRAGRGALSGAA
jgi:hypothetical protein